MCDSDTNTVNSQDDGRRICWSDDDDKTDLQLAEIEISKLKHTDKLLRAKIRHLRREVIKKDEEVKQLV